MYKDDIITFCITVNITLMYNGASVIKHDDSKTVYVALVARRRPKPRHARLNVIYLSDTRPEANEPRSRPAKNTICAVDFKMALSHTKSNLKTKEKTFCY